MVLPPLTAATRAAGSNSAAPLGHLADAWGAYTLYAIWQMRSAALLCYASWRERSPLAAVDAENRSLRKGSTPPGSHAVTDLPRPCAVRLRLATARGLG